MSVDIQALRNKMQEKGVSFVAMANAIGVDQATIYRKMKSKGEKFTVGEMHKIVSILGLEPGEAAKIFLFQNSQ